MEEARLEAAELINLIKTVFPGSLLGGTFIVLIDVLPDALNIGYAQHEDKVVKQVNGKAVHSMRELIAAFESHDEPYHHIELGRHGEALVLDRKAVAQRREAVLKNYRVPAERSEDLR